MSDETPTPPEKPSSKTSSVPLKKETVRITLRKGAGSGSAPPPAPGAPLAPRPPAMPAAPAPPLGAKTVPLTPAPPAAAPPAAGGLLAQPTAKLTPAGAPSLPGSTRPLPKATVKLQPTQTPGSTGPGVAPITTGQLSGELDDSSAEAGTTPFAAICLTVALVAFSIGFFTSQEIFEQDKRGEPTYAVPIRDYKHGSYEKIVRATGEINWAHEFANDLPEIREYAVWKKSQL
jgi:hypothetical protein